jgi:hypothetical protein
MHALTVSDLCGFIAQLHDESGVHHASNPSQERFQREPVKEEISAKGGSAESRPAKILWNALAAQREFQQAWRVGAVAQHLQVLSHISSEDDDALQFHRLRR